MQTLEQWLSVATSGLCESAAERVRAEIGEHYASALESAETTDDDALDVERRAVAALGDAKTANRQYRRVLLTEGEDVLLRGLTSKSHWLWAGIFLLPMAVALVAIPASTLGHTNNYFAALIIDGLLRAIPVASSGAGWIVRTVRWGVLTVGLIALVSGWGDQIKYVPGIVLFAVGVVHTEYRLFVLRRKVPVEQWPRRLKV